MPVASGDRLGLKPNGSRHVVAALVRAPVFVPVLLTLRSIQRHWFFNPPPLRNGENGTPAKPLPLPRSTGPACLPRSPQWRIRL